MFETFASYHHHRQKDGSAGGGLLQANPFLPPFSRLHYTANGVARKRVSKERMARSPPLPLSLPPFPAAAPTAFVAFHG